MESKLNIESKIKKMCIYGETNCGNEHQKKNQPRDWKHFLSKMKWLKQPNKHEESVSQILLFEIIVSGLPEKNKKASTNQPTPAIKQKQKNSVKTSWRRTGNFYFGENSL